MTNKVWMFPASVPQSQPSTHISPKVIKSEAGPNNPRVKKRNCGNKKPHMQGICSLSVIHTPFYITILLPTTTLHIFPSSLSVKEAYAPFSLQKQLSTHNLFHYIHSTRVVGRLVPTNSLHFQAAISMPIVFIQS